MVLLFVILIMGLNRFVQCISQNGSDISRCQFFIDMLNQCRRDSPGGIATATAFT
jgi:hypothetical protein